MASEIFSLVGRIALEGRQAVERGLDSIERSSADAGGGLQRLGRKFDALGETVGNVGGTMSKWVTGPLAAVGTGIGAIATKGAETARNIQQQAKLTGVGVEKFQEYAFAAKSVGVEQDKLADIFKDVSDKIGDFNQNEAGPLKDFFENIAPQVGITADSFKGLSGKDALQLYQSSLEAANVSQQDMTFYMEAIASDASLLTPLLENGGEAFNKLGAEAQAAGLILSEETLQSLNESRGALDKFGTATEVTGVLLADALMPAIQSLIPLLTETVVPAIRDAAAKIKEWTEAFRSLSPELQQTIIKATLFAAAVGPILVVLGPVIKLLGSVIGLFGKLKAIAAVATPVIAAVSSVGLAPIVVGVGAAVAAFFILKAAFETIQAVVDRFGPTIKRIIGDMFDSVVGFFKRLPGMAIGFITNMVSGVVNRVKNMAQNVISSIKDMFNAVVGNSIIPDMANASIAEAEKMRRGVGGEADQMRKDVVGAADGMPDSIGAGAGGVGRGSGDAAGRAGVNVDLRHATIRDDKDMLDRLRAAGVDLNGALG